MYRDNDVSHAPLSLSMLKVIECEEYMKKKRSFLHRVEKIGNAMPHPVYIFLILIGIIIFASSILHGVKLTNPSNGESIIIKSLANREGIIWFLKNAVSNFIKFPPLGMVLVTALGVGLAEETGLMKDVMTSLISKSPIRFVTPIVIFVSIIGNVAGSAAFAILPPLGAIIFKSVNKHPLAGLAAGFIGVAGGLSANILITPTDVVNSGITQAVVENAGSSLPVNPAINWYFMIASTFLLTIVATIVIEKITIPKLGNYVDDHLLDNERQKHQSNKSALRYAGIAALLYIAIIALTILPKHGILRSDTGSIVPSPFLDSMIMILTGLFLFPALAYGWKAKTISSSIDVIHMFEKAIHSFTGFIVMCFFAAQFVEAFAYTNLGFAVSSIGASMLKNSGLIGIPLIIIFIICVAFINFFVGILSAKWALLAPIFIPMFMQLGITPYFTQAAFRIADSVTNPISPLEAFMPFMISVAQKYDKKAGLGTMITLMLPLSISFLIVWTILLIIWYVLNLPLGPGAGIFLR